MNDRSLKTSDFHYVLPEELIARYPSPRRSGSRLLCLDRPSGAVEHRQFVDLPALLQPCDLLVFNNTRVIPARLLGHKVSGGKVEVLVERLLNAQECLAHVRNAKSLKPGAHILLNDEQRLTVLGRAGENGELVHLRCDPLRCEPLRCESKPRASLSLLELLEAQGHMPLPPYIDRADELSDRERYQTVYSKVPGAVAAPTAGLHFDEALLAAIRARGVQTAEVTLHVGAGTFQPVRVEHIADHVMHKEWFSVPEAVCEQVKKTRAAGGRVIAVGTTSVRCLESAAVDGVLKAASGETDIFITPGYDFKVIDGLLTNFHLPESTLLMLVSALAGRDHILAAYQQAIEARYRFFSYGDAMWII